MTNSNFGKGAGILLHISSLPSKHGIGTFGEAAYRFVDFLAEADQQYWQMLPLGMTGYGNSPYQSPSAFAGNINFIDLDMLASQNYIFERDYADIDWGNCESRIDYNKIYAERTSILKKAANQFHLGNPEFIEFCKTNSFWIDDFALFMAIKEHHNMQGLDQWSAEYLLKNDNAIEDFSSRHKHSITFYKITQFWFYQQLGALKKYVNSLGIRIIGDIPFYVAYDSADVWANPAMFELDENLLPKNVAGVPPDSFSEDGQLWGNPLYDYEEMRKDWYLWWRQRIKQCFLQCDILRIDHFRAIDSYYAVPYNRPNARQGEWRKGEGMDFIQALNLKNLPIIVEDLGDINDSVRELIEKTGLPNMKVLQFAFDSDSNNEFLPRNYQKDCVVYTGTHDNNTVKGWYKTLSIKQKCSLLRHVPYSLIMSKSSALIRYAHKSGANIAIIPLQDYLNFDETARMNIPSTLNNNWEWRVTYAELSDILVNRIKRQIR